MIRLGIFERLMLVAAKWKEDCSMFVLFFLPAKNKVARVSTLRRRAC